MNSLNPYDLGKNFYGHEGLVRERFWDQKMEIFHICSNITKMYSELKHAEFIFAIHCLLKCVFTAQNEFNVQK